jgi:hypothetical protein
LIQRASLTWIEIRRDVGTSPSRYCRSRSSMPRWRS